MPKSDQRLISAYHITLFSNRKVIEIRYKPIISQGVFERRWRTFALSGSGFAQIFKQVVSIRVKKLSNTNFKASRHHFQLTCAAYKRLCLSPYLRLLLLLVLK